MRFNTRTFNRLNMLALMPKKMKTMKNKVMIVLAAMFLSQMFFSCWGCDCPAPSTFENNYTDVSIIPYDTSGFNPKILVNKAHKNAFGLGISVIFEPVKIADNFKLFSGLGFTSAMAFSCDCAGDKYLYPDPIDYVNIYIIDTQTDQKIDVTENFKIYFYSNELMSLSEFFKQRENWQDGFQIELVAYETMPNAVIFIAEVFLKSGKTFSNKTQVVNFYE